MMREQILALLERNSKLQPEEIAVLLGSGADLIRDEIRKMEERQMNGEIFFGADGVVRWTSNNRVMPKDCREILADCVDNLGIFSSLTCADVDNDLVKLGDLHHALVGELFHKSRCNFIYIEFFQSCHFLLLLTALRRT